MKKYFAGTVLIIGILALSWSSFAQQSQKPAEKEKLVKPGRPAQMAPLARLKEYLNLSPEQEAKLNDVLKARVEDRKASQEQIKKTRSELTPLLKDPKTDQNKINSLIDQIAKMRADQTKKALASRRDMEKIFTSEQLDKLKQSRGQLMRRGLLSDFFMGRERFMQRGRFIGPGMRPGLSFRGQRWFGNRLGRGLRMMRRPGLRFGRSRSIF